MADNSSRKSIITPYGKLSFCYLFTPRPPMDGKGDARYSTNLIIPAKQMKTAEFKALQDAIIECAKDFFGEKVDLKRLRLPIRKGSERDYEGYTDDSVFINPWSKQKPGVLDRDMNEILIPDDVYAGQVARLSVTPFGYDNSGNKGVSLSLNHVQIAIKDAPRLDGRRSAADTFAKAEATTSEDELAEIFGIEGSSDDAAAPSAAPATSGGDDYDALMAS